MIFQEHLRALLFLYATIFSAMNVLFPSAAHADASTDFGVTRTPYPPTLVVNKSPELCALVLKDHIRQTNSANGSASQLNYMPWKELSSHSEKGNTRNGDEYLGFLERLDLDLEGTGETQTLIQWETPFNWRTAQVFVRFHGTKNDFDSRYQKVISDGTRQALWQLESSGGLISPPIENYKQETHLQIFEFANQFFFSDTFVRNLSIQEERLTTYRIRGDGSIDEVCSIPLSQADQARKALLSRPKFADFYAILKKALGDYGSTCGSAGTGSRLSAHAWERVAVIAHQPWKAVGEVIPDWRRKRYLYQDLFLRRWAQESLWNFRAFKGFDDKKQAATEDLSLYLQEAFGVGQEASFTHATALIEYLIRSHLNLPYTWDEGGEDAQMASRNIDARSAGLIVLEGTPSDEVDNIIAHMHNPDGTYNSADETLVFFALEHPKFVTKIHQAGANLNHQNIFGKTPLMYAAHFNLLETAKTLLDLGADPNQKTWTIRHSCDYAIQIGNRTALMYAAENASLDFIRLLLDHDADKSALDTNGKMISDYLEANSSLSSQDKETALALLRHRREASFDCDVAQNHYQETVCSDDRLKALDYEMVRATNLISKYPDFTEPSWSKDSFDKSIKECRERPPDDTPNRCYETSLRSRVSQLHYFLDDIKSRSQ